MSNNSFFAIEKKFEEHAAIKRCVLVVTGKSEQMKSSRMILIALTSEDYSEKPDHLVIDELMAFICDVMSSQDVPEKIVLVDAFPLTSEGEIDRKALQTMVLP